MEVGKILATGALTPVSTLLYSSPAGKETLITNIEMVNISGGTRILNLQVLKYGSAVKVNRSPKDMSLTAGSLVTWNYSDQIILSQGDAIYGFADIGDTITYLIAGYTQPDNGI